MAPQKTSKAWPLAALLWLAFVLTVAAHQWQFWQAPPLNTDVLALLPENEHAPELTRATRQLADQASRQIVVMLGTPDWATTRAAAAAWRANLAQSSSAAPLQPSPALDPQALSHAVTYYRPWRDRLLTPAQREQLQSTPAAAQLQTALTALYQPAAGAKLSDWAADPLGLWPQWWAERAGDTRARPRDGELWLAAEGREWLVLGYEITGPAFALSSAALYGDALNAAEAAARKALLKAQPTASPSHRPSDLRVLRAGIPLHAEAAAVQANWEVNTIGWGSLAAVLLLVWLAFRSLRPIVLVALSLGVGCAAALSVTAWVFGEVHLITLVFGASLVGVAEDYGIHYFASRQQQPSVPPRTLMRRLLPGLILALVTSVLAYLVLGFAPFPGLRQMALFSAVGLVAAFFTSVCWFPLLDRTAPRPTRFASVLAGSLVHWPQLRPSRRWGVAAAVLVVLTAIGLSVLRTNDDIRQLQGSPAALVASQREVGRLLGVPSPAQFYLVQGRSAEEVLQREEALKARLDALVAQGRIAGYRAVSDWVPSTARQAADAALVARVEQGVLSGVNATLGEAVQRPAFAAAPLVLADWLAQPVSAPVRGLWLGDIGRAVGSTAGGPAKAAAGGASEAKVTSVVMLRGVHEAAQLPALEAASQGLPGVRWVDKAGEVSSLLGRYRHAMTLLLLVGHGLVLLALALRFGRAAWRAWLPTALASVFTVALLAAVGQPFQLFTVLALVLLLGMGVDYGIFLLEHEGDPSAWLAVMLGAASTWLSFGLLGLSATPALRAFGLTLMLGIPLVWVMAPLMRPMRPVRQVRSVQRNPLH